MYTTAFERTRAFLTPPPGVPLGVSSMSRDGTGRLVTWVENGCKMQLTYQPSTTIPKRLTATASRLGTMVTDFTFTTGQLTGYVGDYIPTMLLAEISALGATPLSELGGGGGGVSLSNNTPADLGVAVPGLGSTASRWDHVHRKPTALELAALSVPVAWNSSTNTPTLASGTPPASATAYVVTVGSNGVTTLDGISRWVVGDIAVWDPVAVVWTKIAADGTSERAWTNRGTGNYHGERLRIGDSPTGLAMAEWNATRGQWGPVGKELWSTIDPLTVAAAVNNGYTPTSVNIFGGMLGTGANAVYSITREVLLQLKGSSATSRTVQMTYGATQFVNTTSTVTFNRRLGIRAGFRGKAASGSQWVFQKFDSAAPEKDWNLDVDTVASVAGGSGMSEDSSLTKGLGMTISWLNSTALPIEVIKDNVYWQAA